MKKKRKREREKGGWRWEQNRRLSQALGLGWGLCLGEWALALTRGPWVWREGVTPAGVGRAWQTDPKPTLPALF